MCNVRYHVASTACTNTEEGEPGVKVPGEGCCRAMMHNAKLDTLRTVPQCIRTMPGTKSTYTCIHLPPYLLHLFLQAHIQMPSGVLELPHPFTQRLILGLSEVCKIPHLVPVDPVPPRLEVFVLAPHAVILHPHVLPRVHAEQRHDVDTAERLLRFHVHLCC